MTALHHHFFTGGDARPIISALQNRNRILIQVRALVDAGEVRTTLTERFSPINAANLKRAHQALESTTARGKIVIEGWQ